MKVPIWFSAGLITASVATAIAKTQSASHGLSPAEKWVIAQVNAGEVADLTKQFPNEDERKLSAHFLEDLLTGTFPGVKPRRNGVRISGATIDEPIDLTNAQIPCEAYLEHCQFMRPVTFGNTSVAGNASFFLSTFKAAADFVGMKVGDTAFFIHVVFEGPVNFVEADIAGNFVAHGAQFKNKDQGASFNSMKVGGSMKVGSMKVGGAALFENAVFEGPVNFVRAHIAVNFEAQEAQFKNQGQSASFNGMKVGGDAFFENTVFEGPVDFVGADFAGNFVAHEAHFKNIGQSASFNGMKVGHTAFFKSAVFEGPVDFRSADIAGNFGAQEAQFKNMDKGATFNSMKAGGAFFEETVFEGTADFRLADIARNFEARKVQFKNKDQGAYFYGMKVGKIARFEKAVFEGQVEFGAADIAGNFEAGEAQFRNKTETAWLIMKCGRQGVFKDVVFAGPVSFQDSSFLDLVIGDMKPGAPSVPRLDLSRSSIKRHLSIRKISIQDLVAPWLHVEGPADFTDITVEHSADLSYGDFFTLDLSRSIWPKDAGPLNMQEMSYKYVRAAPSERESHEALLKLAGQSVYSADVYGNLEAFFLRQGYRDDADRAFIKGKRRERKENLHGLGWLGSWLLDGLVGYGRHPERAGYVCLGIVALGCILFPLKKMELQDPKEAEKPEKKRRQYNRFWYSLGLFLPVVDLKTSELWGPKHEYRFLRNYLRVHILLGWILVPIFLAAVSGLIK